MACLTCFCRRDVVGWFHCRENGTDLGVAAYAGRTRTFENATRVASVATDILVCTIEVEPGAEMVKWLLRFRG